MLVVAVGAAVVWFGIASTARSNQRFREAAAHHGEMSDEDIVKLETRILGRLYRRHSPHFTMTELSADIQETYESTCLAIERLLREHSVAIVEREAPAARESPEPPNPYRRPGPYERVRLTVEGSTRFHDRTTKGGINVGGDYIAAGAGAFVTNRATVTNSFNTFADRYSTDVADALVRLERAVADSKSVDAAECLEALLDHLKTPSPKPSVLRRLFTGITEAAPAVMAMTDTVAKLSSLFGP